MRKRNVLEAYGLPSDEEFERFGREADAVMARAADCTRRHSGSDSASGVIYKTYETPPPRQQQINDLDPAVQARWDAWFAKSFGQHAEEFAGVLGDETGKMTREERRLMREYVDGELHKLREEIGGLRAELTTLQAIMKGEVAPLVRRVTRDDAA